MSTISLNEFLSLRISDRCSHFSRDSRLLALVYAQQFDRPLLAQLFKLADRIRALGETRDGRLFLRLLLPGRRAMLYFTQPSTRTFLSFAAACQILGMSTSNVRDPATSSEIKGETREDGLRIFAIYHDLIIMRQPEADFCEKIAFHMLSWPGHKPIINAGSGTDQHPTQALLDLYTLQRCFAEGGIENKRIMLVGDLKRGRTARSLAYLLTIYPGVELILAAPAELAMDADIKEHLAEQGTPFVETEDMQKYLPQVDAIYMTRIQDEWDKGPAKTTIDYGRFGLRAEHLHSLKPHCAILHPLPRRKEIETEIDADPRAIYFDQAENGMWVRAALIAHMFAVDQSILSSVEK